MRHDGLLKHMICIEDDGAATRMKHCTEEMAELIVAMSHYQRRRPGCRAELIDELGDAVLTIRGVILALGLAEDVEARIQHKADRLEEEYQYETEVTTAGSGPVTFDLSASLRRGRPVLAVDAS